MATDENGEGKAKGGLAGIVTSVVLRIVASIRSLYDGSAPWLMLVDMRKFGCPDSVGEGLHRFRRNSKDFGYNYCLLLLAVSVGCVFMRPFSLFVIACLLMLWAYIFYVRADEYKFRGVTLTLRAQGLLLAIFSAFIVFVATDVNTVLMGGLTGGGLLCAGHAVMRTPEPQVGDGEKGLMGGFADFVSTSISSNAAALEKVSDMIPTKWSQQMDGLLGKAGLNL
mmetsp:Transcript_3926/g.9419  ORF Transcript_3926/g.9419 Transcript_3926/m.9419 type:complete len:224 (+) Transcript_3926:541-1212(+)